MCRGVSKTGEQRYEWVSKSERNKGVIKTFGSAIIGKTLSSVFIMSTATAPAFMQAITLEKSVRVSAHV